jgi:hypothetical protein
MFVRYLIGLALAVAFVQSVRAQEPDDQEPRLRIEIEVSATVPDDEKWIELQSRNFLLAGTASESDIRKVAADLELLRETFAQFNPRIRAISSVPTTVIVFRENASFRLFQPGEGRRPDQIKGYVQPGHDRNYIVLKEGAVPREVYRDYLRLLIPEAMGPVPLSICTNERGNHFARRVYVTGKHW